jgi:gamma-glutamyl hercynylcysteine S-oxide synthase
MSQTAVRSSTLKSKLVARLDEARQRTLLLVQGLSDEELHRQHDPLMSPIIWDVGHIAHFEELWLTRNLDGPIEFSEMPGMFNPFEHPRASRAALPIPPISEMLDRLSDIRERVLERLETIDLDDGNPLLAGGYVYEMVLQHEYQHNETILQTLQLKLGEPYHPPRRTQHPDAPLTAIGYGEMIAVPEGAYTIGTDDRTAAYDNERPRHVVELDAFRIDRTPVTNGAWLEFMADGGYATPSLWTAAGLAWLAESGAESPKYWARAKDGWTSRSMDVTQPVEESKPVCHVCYHEAEAFARWAGKRLPTEQEWEVAASWNPASASAYDYPWGEAPVNATVANVDQLSFAAAPILTYDRNVSPFGCYGMIGDVWEWTSSDFGGYPGFEAFPYPEYSQEFFGSEYKVLRGGSWATRPGAIRNTFRNWDYPVRRQIFSGLRCAASG